MGNSTNSTAPGQFPPDASPPQSIVYYTHYFYPLALFCFFLVALTWWGISISQSSKPTPPSVTGIYENGKVSKKSNIARSGGGFLRRFAERFPGGMKNNGKRDAHNRLTPMRKAVFNWLLVGVVFTFVLNAANVILHALTKHGWWCGKDYVVSTVSLIFTYALMLISQLDNDLYPTLPHLAAWVFGLSGEVVLLVANILTYEQKHGSKDRGGNNDFLQRNWDIVDLSIDVLRIVLLVLLVGLYLVLIVFSGRESDECDSEETSSLLASSSSSTATGVPDYGSMPAHRKHGTPEPSAAAPAGWGRRAVIGKQSWWEYLQGYTIFFPYLWPSKDRRLQLLMIICFIIVILQRGVNVMVPHQLGRITNILSGDGEDGEDGQPPRLPYEQILLYIVYRLLQGNMGILGAIRSALWIPVGQYSYQALSTSAFEHVHSLSLDFHLGKKTGEVLSALSKGNAINTFLEQVSFQVVPMLVDLAVAVGYFLVEFDVYYALIVAIVTFCYLYITVRMAQWRADIRREMVNKSREEDAVKNDSMVAYETVKYFNAERYEFERYRNAVKAYQKAEYKVLFSLNVMNVTQNMVFTTGLVAACFLSAWQVSTGQVKVGRFVALLAYLAQLQGPLNFFGTFYRSIQSAMINSERMLELFREQPTVVDKPGVEVLPTCEGEIAFKDVYFSYDSRKPALRGLSFVAKPGTTTAFVGESGGGKTTVLRLLFRFYDVQEGRIEVDGKDVRDITIDSLRKHIGVVPQDTVLFNETIMYNLKYANPNATDEMVYQACRAASIHDKIMGFPDGYNTKVGERGLRLSGGEKQRVAIARTILKNPKIILLDEATAALDSETEQHIQAALKELARGRTTLVIAHRLSTITSANQILCLHEGQVVEAGTHEELLAKNGRYAMMWRKQIRAEQKQKQAAMSSDGESEDSQEEGGPLIDLRPSHPSRTPEDGQSMLESEAVTPEVLDSPPGELNDTPGATIPSAQHTAGAEPGIMETEVTPKTLAAEIVADDGVSTTSSGSPSRKGKSKDRDGLLKRSSSTFSTSGGGPPAKWSARGLRKALSLKSTVLHKRSASYSGSASASGSERVGDDK